MKKGFTLAEVLITLAIIGVVATITLPTLNTNIIGSEAGPKLMKAVSVLEQANRQLLADKNVSRLSLTDTRTTNYTTALADYITMTQVDANGFTTRDGISYTFENTTGEDITPQRNPANDFYRNVQININSNQPNPRAGRDLFFVTLFNNGSILPVGAAGSFDQLGRKGQGQTTCGTLIENNPEDNNNNNNNGDAAQGAASQPEVFSSSFKTTTAHYDYTFCAANIFQNGGKIQYANGRWME